MLGFFEPKEKKAIKKTFMLWYQACSMFLNRSALRTPRGKLGTTCFFIGSIDAISQPYKMEDKEWGSLTKELMTKIAFSEEATNQVLKKYYIEKNYPAFIEEAITAGGQAASSFLSGQNKMSPMVLLTLLNEWAENPDLKPDEAEILFG